MRLRRTISRAGLAALAGSAALLPSAARACELTDPGCYIDDFAHQQVRELALSIWQINRAGLVLARWVEDLRAWLTETVLVDAFTQLVGPVRWMFFLALIIAWMLFVISFMVQALVDLRWVDLRRAAGPIMLALLVFAKGGALLQESERIRMLGSGILQGIAQSAVPASVPAISMIRSGELPAEPKPLYEQATTCGTTARAVPGLALNDYGAYYLLANADDIHCAEALRLATDFRTAFFGAESIADMDSWQRQGALSLAAQGGLHQVTGLFMTTGALIEQLMHLLFALALALVWFGLLLSLVFAVFLPSEALFTQQLRALLTVIRASWLASFLLGLGLAILSKVAASGNGFVLLICGLVLIAVCLWQCRQALGVLHSAASSASAAMAGAPQAVGGMLRSWATTGALVAGVAATGGIGPAATQIGATMARRMGRQAGDNPLARAAGRVLSRRVADRLDALTADQQIAHEADLGQAEAAWYERLPPELAPADAPVRAQAARAQSQNQQARLLERRASRARQQRNFALSDQLRRMAAALRPSRQAPISSPGAEPPAEQIEPDAQLAHPTEPLARRARKAQIASVRGASRPASTGERLRAPVEPARKSRLRVMRKADSTIVNGSEERSMDLSLANEMTADASVAAVRRISLGSLGQKPAERQSADAAPPKATSMPSAERPAFRRTRMPEMMNFRDNRAAIDTAHAAQATEGASAILPAAPDAPLSDLASFASVGPAHTAQAIEPVTTIVPAAPDAPQSDATGRTQDLGYWQQPERFERDGFTSATSAQAGAIPAKPEPAPDPAPAQLPAPASPPVTAQPPQPIASIRDSAPPQPAPGRSTAAPAPPAPEHTPAAAPRALPATPPAGVPTDPRPRPAAPQAGAPAVASRASAPQQPWKRKRGQA